MKICIYGTGAVGGFIGAQLARAGLAVNAVDQGPTLKALQTDGLRLQSQNGLFTEKVTATDDPTSLGVQDLVIIAVKATAMVHIAGKLRP